MSIARLNELLTRSELLAGAFYGKVADLTFGAEKLQSIADFAQELSQKAVLKA